MRDVGLSGDVGDYRGEMIVLVPVLVVLMGALKVIEAVLVVHEEGSYYMSEWRCRWSY